MDTIINNLPIELHLPSWPNGGENVPGGSFNSTSKMSFCGPGTKLADRVKQGYKGVNELDSCCRDHDVAYNLYKDREKRNIADRILADKALKIAQDARKNGYERAWAALVYKTFCEGGLTSKFQGGKLTARKKDGPSSETLKQLAEELHKPARRKFPRRRVRVQFVDETWGMDLVDLQKLNGQNDGYRYILSVIDIFSKYAWAVPVKNKSGNSVFNAFTKIINDSARQPKNIWVDEGTEFYNSTFTKWLNKNGVKIYSTYEDFHNSVVERFNRTLKTKMWKRFTAENTRRWIDMLDELVDTYNNSVHSTIKMTPLEACDQDNWDMVRTMMYPTEENPKHKHKFNLGDIVRLSEWKGKFSKSYERNWTDEVFRVVAIKYTQPVTYQVEDLNGEQIEGSFYETELQKSQPTEENVYKMGGKDKTYILWSGYGKPEVEFKAAV